MDQEEELQLYREEAKNDLLFYTVACDPNYTCSRVHKFLAKKLEAVALRKIKRLIITVHPRLGKSRLTSIEFATWLLGKDPKTKIVLGCYGQDLANYNSRECRRRLQDEAYQTLFDTRISPDDAQVAAWSTTEGGGYKAVGVGGPLTGRGANVILIDDVVKDFQEAHSITTQNAIEDWFRSVAFTRLEPDGVIVIIMTRWSKNDLVGRILSNPEEAPLWEIINLPAIAEDNDPLGREFGEALFPERFPVEKLLEIKKSVGSYVWSALYEGQPVVRGGNYIPIEKIKIVDEAPEGIWWVRTWDLATSEKTSADFTASVCCGIGEDGTFYVKNGIRGRWEWPTAREKIATIAKAEQIPVGVEAVAGFKTAFANLREVIDPRITLREFGVDKDKLTRALPWIARVENGKFAVVRGAWVSDFLSELESFPSGHDDFVDSTSLASSMLEAGRQMPMTVNIHDKYSVARSFRKNRQLIG